MTPAEIIAKHICCPTNDGCFSNVDKPCLSPTSTENAECTITALDKAGFVIVPRTPTEKMLVAGIKVCSHAAITNAPQTAVIYGQPKDIYQAMIEAWTHD